MTLKTLEISGFKSFAKKSVLNFNTPISSIVGPNGSGKSNVAEAFRFVLGEQSIKSLRGKRGEDMIFNGGKQLARGNRASVKVVFDNSDRRFTGRMSGGGVEKEQVQHDEQKERGEPQKTAVLDFGQFDEITLERVVHRDSSNEYFINGSQVRLKDIVELLAQASIGSSGHHIISQGEADRVLTASILERREMIEDALGLNVFQYKKIESLKKLEKTKENMKQVESLLRELAPHVKFLKKQVEKIEKATELRTTLTDKFLFYFKNEEHRLTKEKEKIESDESGPKEKLIAIDRQIKNLEATLSKEDAETHSQTEIKKITGDLEQLRQQKNNLLREAGKLEGEKSYLERERDKKEREADRADDVLVPLSTFKEWSKEIEEKIDAVIADFISKKISTDELLKSLKNLRLEFGAFVSTQSKTEAKKAELSALNLEISKLQETRKNFELQVVELEEREEMFNKNLLHLKETIDSNKDQKIAAERDMLKLMTEKNSLQNDLSHIMIRRDHYESDQTMLERDIAEAAALIGHEILQFRKEEVAQAVSIPLREEQMEVRRDLERMKIKLEEVGISNMSDVLKEYKDAEERDSFLRREVTDLESSSTSLRSLISDLENTIDLKFKDGISHINEKFHSFFSAMFGGGKAGLIIVKEQKRKKKGDIDDEITLASDGTVQAEIEEQIKEGIDINVELPHKKTKGLMMLSGGERALTSIALLFAMSQVNPPPFIILDETDAALDEANSRKYGDMIETLASYSQLILITHNRETMSRAGVIYGITMSGEGSSQMLSIAFEEASKVAK